MKLDTTRFGTIEVKDDDVLSFPEGLLGFAAFTKFVILPNPTGGPLSWLQSIDDGKLAFVICQPQIFKPDYKIAIRPEELEPIELRDLTDALVYTIMVVPAGNPRAMTANLQGPVIINRKKRVAKQYVLINSEYTTKHRVFPDA